MQLIYQNELEFESRTLVNACQIFRAINHSLRQQMLDCLVKEGKRSVTSLCRRLGIQQAVCSQQLAILRSAGLVQAERAGKRVYHSVNDQRLKALQAMAYKVIRM